MQTRIDRCSLLPLYYQLKQVLLGEIERRGLTLGDRLPGDHELSATYRISRTVVRQALTELEHEGVIERIKGRGTFVAGGKTGEGLVQAPLTGLYEDVAARGGHLTSLVRRQEVVPADDQVAAALDLRPEHPVTVIERLRFVDGAPWVLTLTHVPEDLAPGLVDENLADQSLYALLEGRYRLQLAFGRRSVEATLANAALARDLGIRRGGAVLALRNVTFQRDGRPVETFVAYHRGDRSRFEVELTRQSDRETRPLMIVTN
jgi:GntR family transcriptional regulator